MSQDLFSIAVDQPFRFPATFTFVLRAFSTLEGEGTAKRGQHFCVHQYQGSLCFLSSHFYAGVGKTLDPDFSFPKIAAPYAQVRASEGERVVVLHNEGHSRDWISIEGWVVRLCVSGTS